MSKRAPLGGTRRILNYVPWCARSCPSVSSGTFESELCPDQRFLCGDETSTFDRCMHAIDCKMNFEMRIVKVRSVCLAAHVVGKGKGKRAAAVTYFYVR